MCIHGIQQWNPRVTFADWQVSTKDRRRGRQDPSHLVTYLLPKKERPPPQAHNDDITQCTNNTCSQAGGRFLFLGGGGYWIPCTLKTSSQNCSSSWLLLCRLSSRRLCSVAEGLLVVLVYVWWGWQEWLVCEPAHMPRRYLAKVRD